MKALPTRVKLLDWGLTETVAGPVIVDLFTAKVFSANQKTIGRERVVVDFEHNTVPGTPEYERTTEPRPVAGHSSLVCLSGDGIFAENIIYTPTGLARGLDYEDVSLAPMLDKENRVVAAHSWALTHAGAVRGATFSSALPFRTRDSAGRTVIDMAALLNHEHQQAEAPSLTALSATHKPFAKPLRWKDAHGREWIDLAAIFDREAGR